MLIILLWYLFCYSPIVTEEVVVYPEIRVIKYERPRPTKVDVVSPHKTRRAKSDRYTVVIAAAQQDQPQLPYVGE